MSRIASWIYERQLGSRGVARRLWALCRSLLIALFRDPECVMPVHGRKLAMPLSHALPLYSAAHRHYDTLLTRVGEYLAVDGRRLVCIDVGANVGDTIAAMYRDDARFLAIEPSRKYRNYLHANWGSVANVTTVDAVCSSVSATKSLQLVEKSGTATLEQADGPGAIAARTLDDIVDSNRVFAEPTVIKIDTDGHDFEVLVGARKIIGNARPIVLFECDAFGNAQYVEDCLEALARFKSVGYRSFLVYDNLGYLMGRHALSDLGNFKDLLLYQLTSTLRYFDILVMDEPDIDRFYQSERFHFSANALKDSRLFQSAAALRGDTNPARGTSAGGTGTRSEPRRSKAAKRHGR